MNGNRPMHTLASAAQYANVHKSTIFRWVRSGRISSMKAEDGTLRIDPSELQRYLDSVAAEQVARQAAQTPATEVSVASHAGEMELQVRVAALEAQLAGMRELLEAERRRADDERRRADEWKGTADRWASQAERLAIAP